MTPRQAAIVIGCCSNNVRTLIKRGKIRADRVLVDPDYPAQGFYWDISPREVARYARKPQGRGYPRGRKRKAD